MSLLERRTNKNKKTLRKDKKDSIKIEVKQSFTARLRRRSLGESPNTPLDHLKERGNNTGVSTWSMDTPLTAHPTGISKRSPLSLHSASYSSPNNDLWKGEPNSPNPNCRKNSVDLYSPRSSSVRSPRVVNSINVTYDEEHIEQDHLSCPNTPTSVYSPSYNSPLRKKTTPIYGNYDTSPLKKRTNSDDNHAKVYYRSIRVSSTDNEDIPYNEPITSPLATIIDSPHNSINDIAHELKELTLPTPSENEYTPNKNNDTPTKANTTKRKKRRPFNIETTVSNNLLLRSPLVFSAISGNKSAISGRSLDDSNLTPITGASSARHQKFIKRRPFTPKTGNSNGSARHRRSKTALRECFTHKFISVNSPSNEDSRSSDDSRSSEKSSKKNSPVSASHSPISARSRSPISPSFTPSPR